MNSNGRYQIIRILLLSLLICFMGKHTIYAAKEAPKEQDLFAASAVLMDGESGRILYDKNGMAPLPNASTTKILTCILVLEECDLSEQAFVSAYASQMPKVKLYVKTGEQYAVKDLLYSLMLESHNDSAVVLAEHMGKKWVADLKDRPAEEFTTEESQMALKAFAERMNQKAEEIGCKDSYFITPNGLDATETVVMPDNSSNIQEHHTTARDLALIMSYCILKSPECDMFLKITGTRSYSFYANQRSFSCSNHNTFLDMMEGALSGKTGFTGKAGYCYVGALKKEGRIYVVALLACGWPNNRSYKWSDTRKLMEYGLQNYRREEITSEEILIPEQALPELPVRHGQGEKIDQTITIKGALPDRAPDKSVGVLLGTEEKIAAKVLLPQELEAPVEKGQLLGEICYMLGDEVYYRERIVAPQEILRVDLSWCFRQIFRVFCGGKP